MTNDCKMARIKSDFIEKAGLVAQGEGLPRTAGRLFGLLVFDGLPVSFGDLATQLQVSRGGISSSVRLLEMRGLVKRVSLPGERQDYFQLAADPYSSLLSSTRSRIAAARDDIAATIGELPVEADGIRERLEAYAGLYDAIDQGLGEAVERIACKTLQQSSTRGGA